MDITGMLAIGNGEPCPFCVKENRVEDIFISKPSNDVLQHLMTEHKTEFESVLYGGA